MRYFFIAAFLAALFFGGSAAKATVDVSIDLAHQRMNVTSQSGSYSWPISSGRPGYNTPTGVFQSQAMYRMAYSRIYGNTPMPHSIFFSGNYAIHGTNATGALGRPASHGCVRLAPVNAATLFQMVKAEGVRITISGAPPVAPVVSASSRAKAVQAHGARTKGTKYARGTHGKSTKHASAAKKKHRIATARTQTRQAQPQPPAHDLLGLFSGA